jgi:F0F1-type ATP synthase membrane subunit a
MHTFLLSKIEVGSHLYINFGQTLHLHGETVIVSGLVVFSLILFLFLGTSNLKKIPEGLQNLKNEFAELKAKDA